MVFKKPAYLIYLFLLCSILLAIEKKLALAQLRAWLEPPHASSSSKFENQSLPTLADILNEDVPFEEEVSLQDSLQISDKANRVYCLVPSQYNKRGKRLWPSILQSWGLRCDTIKFFVDPPGPDDEPPPKIFKVKGKGGYPDMEAEVVVLPMVRKTGGICPDGKVCRHIWEKMWRAWVFVSENDVDKAEWFCKIDDDSFFIPSNLRKYVRDQGWSPDDKHYFGYRGWFDPQDTFVSGVSSAFSRGTVREMSHLFTNMDHEYGDRKNFKSGRCVDRDGATEERTTFVCLKQIGILAEPTHDKRFRRRALPLGIPFTLTYFRKKTSESWYWFNLPYSEGQMENCCAPDAWGIHGYKNEQRMLRMEWNLYNTSIDELNKSLDHFTVGEDDWWKHWYTLQLKEGIARDMHQIKTGGLSSLKS